MEDLSEHADWEKLELKTFFKSFISVILRTNESGKQEGDLESHFLMKN